MALELDLWAGVTPQGAVTLRIRTGNNHIPSAEEFYIHRNGVEILSAQTQPNGFYTFNETIAPGAAKQIQQYEVFLRNSTLKRSARIEINEIASPKKNDPQKIILIRMHDGNGNFRVFIRVIKEGGYGVETDVDILFRNQRYSVRTDARGIFIWDAPFVVNPGEDDPAIHIVDGIENHAAVRLRRRQAYQCPPRFSNAWWRTNNARAFILFCLALIFSLWALWIGIGEPVFNSNMFRNEEVKQSSQESSGTVYLSEQETIFNRVIEDSSPQALIEGESRDLRWHRNVWMIALTFWLAWIIYGLIAMREEISEELSRAVERIMNRDYVQTGDPWFERLVAWTGAYSVAKNPVASVGDGGAGQAPARHSVWAEFPVHLLSDFITEILPAIFRAIV